ncbi:tail fiber assembly protein [Burkholderia multivorans]|uniref:tail fiber assembly protein n=1 Tax=Burkholderia multivorans TaxID=87883 RepID=UPI001C26CA49|nr:tail fiber assembly protein [Burkholderia multivorans]MBU9552424.1 tail fiber assembly protein [Burkholderia multivorans]
MGQKFASHDENGRINGFYDDEDSPPPESSAIVELTHEQYAMLLNGQTAGKVMAVDENGVPVLREPDPLTAEQILAINSEYRDQLLRNASVALAPLQMAVSLGDATDDETALAKAWVSYTRALKNVDLSSASPSWPSPPDYGASGMPSTA